MRRLLARQGHTPKLLCLPQKPALVARAPPSYSTTAHWNIRSTVRVANQYQANAYRTANVQVGRFNAKRAKVLDESTGSD